MVCHFSVNDTGTRGEGGLKKSDKMLIPGKGSKNIILRVMYFFNDPLLDFFIFNPSR